MSKNAENQKLDTSLLSKCLIVGPNLITLGINPVHRLLVAEEGRGEEVAEQGLH